VIALRYGIDAIESMSTVMEWDVTPPKDRNSEATSMVTTGNAIKGLSEALQPYGVRLDIAAITSRYAVPIEGDANGDGDPDVSYHPPPLRLTVVPDDGAEPAADDESEAA